MKKMNMKVLIVTLLMTAAFFTACEKSEVSNTGHLKIQLTDAPFPTDLVEEANVTITKIEIRKKGGAEDEGEEGGSPFVTLSQEEMSFNLLELTNGVTDTLVDIEVEAGTYDLIRLYVSDASIKLKDGKEYDLKVPSGAQTGIKIFIKPGIVVAGGLSADLLLDFDVSKSFVVKGNLNDPNGFNFKPVIKATNNSTAGSLMGVIRDGEDKGIDGVQVSVIAADTVYATSFSDSVGHYAVLGIEAGTYGVEFDKEGYQSNSFESVEIVAGNSTIQDAVLTKEEPSAE